MLDRYFYIIERDEDGMKCIHLEGNVHLNDADESDTCYRGVSWHWLFIDIDEAKQMIADDEFFECFLPDQTTYLGDITEEEAYELCDNYYGDGEPGTELHIKDITKNTPCGCYWFE